MKKFKQASANVLKVWGIFFLIFGSFMMISALMSRYFWGIVIGLVILGLGILSLWGSKRLRKGKKDTPNEDPDAQKKAVQE